MEESILKLKKEELIDIINFVTTRLEVSPQDLQIKYSWGYNQAGRIIDFLEDMKVISEYEYPKKRKVLLSNEDALTVCLT